MNSKLLNSVLLKMICCNPPSQIFVLYGKGRINGINFLKYLTRRLILKDQKRSTLDSDGLSKSRMTF